MSTLPLQITEGRDNENNNIPIYFAWIWNVKYEYLNYNVLKTKFSATNLNQKGAYKLVT
jgi:hypothetical protein